MKGTDYFNEVIKNHLDKKADQDQLFAASYAKEGKSIEECCSYILQEVKKSGRNGFADEEIYSLAVHYYDEDVKPTKSISARVVVNHSLPDDSKKKTLPGMKSKKKDNLPAPEQKAKKATKRVERIEDQRQLSLF